MNEAEIGTLFTERKQLRAQAESLRMELVARGTLLQEFGRRLAEEPAKVTFANAPPGLGEMPAELMVRPGFEWTRFPDMGDTAQKIQDLRGAEKRIAEITRRLGE